MAAGSSASARPNVQLTALSDAIGHPDELANEQHLAKVIGEILHRYYPPPRDIGFWWAVQVNARGGIANIYNLALSGTHGYVLHLTSMYAPDGLKRVMRAGGELLERAGLPRDPRLITEDKVRELRRNVIGNIKYLEG